MWWERLGLCVSGPPIPTPVQDHHPGPPIPHASLLHFPGDQLPRIACLDCTSLSLSLTVQGSGTLLGVSPQHSLKMKLALQSQESDSIRVCSPVEEAWENLHLEHRMDACVLVTMSAHNRWHLRGMDKRVCSLWSSVSLSSCFPIPQTEVGGESHSPLVGQGKTMVKRMTAGTQAALGSRAPEQSLCGVWSLILPSTGSSFMSSGLPGQLMANLP